MPSSEAYFKKGQSGNPKGRPKGARSLANRRLDPYASCLKHDFDPFEKLIQIAKNPSTSTKYVVEACKELLPYLAAKHKTIELSAGEGEAVSVTLNFGSSDNRAAIENQSLTSAEAGSD